MSLRRQAFSAVRWTTAGTLTKALLQVGQVAVLARLLHPEDYGLMAMTTVVLSFAGLFSDLGVNSAFVQRREVSEEQRSSLFWFNVAVSIIVMLTAMGVSPLVGAFFGDNRIIPLMILSATNFLLGALGGQVLMSAEKALRFRPVMLLEVSAALVGFATAVTAAMAGWGVYALVLGGISSAAGSTILAWAFLAEGWRPIWRLRFEDVRSFLGFGGALVANNVVNQFNGTIDLFLGGRLLSAAQLGLYSIPRSLTLQLQSVVNPIITRVAFPLIAEVQEDIAGVRSIYLQMLNMTASTNAPAYVAMAFFAPEIVQVMLGPGWERSGGILSLLALWGGLRSTLNPVGSLLLGMGRADLSLKWNLGGLFVGPPAIWLGSTYGPEGMAWAMLAVVILMFIPGWFLLVRPLCHAGLLEYGLAALRPFLFATVAMIPAYLGAELLSGAFPRLVLGAALAVPLYVGLSYLANRRWVLLMMELAGRQQTL